MRRRRPNWGWRARRACWWAATGCRARSTPSACARWCGWRGRQTPLMHGRHRQPEFRSRHFRAPAAFHCSLRAVYGICLTETRVEPARPPRAAKFGRTKSAPAPCPSRIAVRKDRVFSKITGPIGRKPGKKLFVRSKRIFSHAPKLLILHGFIKIAPADPFLLPVRGGVKEPLARHRNRKANEQAA